MSKSYQVVVMGGDYCGPEVMAEALKVLNAIQERRPDVQLELSHQLVGGISVDIHGVPLTEDALTAAKNADAVLFGAVGGPKWGIRNPPPESGLGQLRKELQTYANLRPVFFAAPSLVDLSPLKPSVCGGASMTIVRELNGGIYYGARNEPNVTLDSASDLDCYTRGEIERITRLAGALAVAHNPPLRVTSLDKANLLAACGRLWRGVVSETMAREFPSVELKHMLIDSAAMVMVRNPRSLNGVVLTSNMFGDIISDEASVIPGSLGLLPSASLCGIPSEDPKGRVRGLYEPIHGKYPFDSRALSRVGFVFLLTTGFLTTGSAPDIAGNGTVNPVGMILSVAMMLRYSLGMPDEAKSVETAVSKVIEDGIRTPDLGGSATTKECGDAIVAALVRENMRT